MSIETAFEKISRKEQLIRKSGDTGLIYPSSILTNKLESRAVKFVAKSYQKKKIDDKELRVEEVSIFLPMPSNMTETNVHNYDTYNGGLVDRAASRIQDPNASVGSNVANTLLDIAATGLSNSIGGKGGELGDIKKTAQKLAGGLAINPRSSLFYANPILKIFNFSYTFIPVSSEEAETVRKIINSFRFYSAPGVLDSGNVFQHPEYWEISFVPDDKFLVKFNVCVLSNVVVTYGDTGPLTLHKDGSPVEVKIELEFKEIEVDTKESIQEKYGS